MRRRIILRIGLLFDRSERGAELHRVGVPKAGLRILGAGVPAACAKRRRAYHRWLAHLQLDATDDLPGLRVDILSKIYRFTEPPDIVQLAIKLVHDQHESALVQMDQQVLSVPLQEQQLV